MGKTVTGQAAITGRINRRDIEFEILRFIFLIPSDCAVKAGRFNTDYSESNVDTVIVLTVEFSAGRVLKIVNDVGTKLAPNSSSCASPRSVVIESYDLIIVVRKILRGNDLGAR